MLKILLAGLWTCAVTLGGTYLGVQWRSRNPGGTSEHVEKALEHKIRPVTVPIIAGGAVKGYVSAEFSFVRFASEGHDTPSLDPESFFMDEAFRLIYSDTQIDFTNLQKTDLSKLSLQLTENVNRRMGRSVVKETLVRNVSFVPREDLPR
ncbi:MAG: flagellar basal body-associated protein FliL [Methylocystis sp.]|nr:MAG: flagellar basal body-associated protein FliL [Methylocystis sp.]